MTPLESTKIFSKCNPNSGFTTGEIERCPQNALAAGRSCNMAGLLAAQYWLGFFRSPRMTAIRSQRCRTGQLPPPARQGTDGSHFVAPYRFAKRWFFNQCNSLPGLGPPLKGWFKSIGQNESIPHHGLRQVFVLDAKQVRRSFRACRRGPAERPSRSDG